MGNHFVLILSQYKYNPTVIQLSLSIECPLWCTFICVHLMGTLHNRTVAIVIQTVMKCLTMKCILGEAGVKGPMVPCLFLPSVNGVTDEL